MKPTPYRKSKRPYAPLYQPLLWAALLLALTGGFGLGAFMVGGVAGWWPLGGWWAAMVQAHGHVQMFGWVGLFILGVGFYFLPRLRGTPLAYPERSRDVMWLLASSIVLRMVAQPALAVWTDGAGNLLARAAMGLSALTAVAGLGVTLVMLVATLREGPPLRTRPGLWSALPWFAAAFVSLTLATLLDAGLALRSAMTSEAIFGAPWNGIVVHLMLWGFALPVAMAFSVRTLPLFLRLPVPSIRSLRVVSIAYVVGLIFYLAGLAGGWTTLSAIGSLVESGAVLGTVLVIDVLTRSRLPWTVGRLVDQVPGRKPTRPGLPDYGEYGRFEWLIYTAYFWLVVGVLLVGAGALLALAGRATPVPGDAARHAVALGFLSILILGMGARMLPGFVNQRTVASTALVELTIWVGNASVVARVLPILLPDLPGATVALGLSGFLGWIAVAALGINLQWTFRARAATPVRAASSEEEAGVGS